MMSERWRIPEAVKAQEQRLEDLIRLAADTMVSEIKRRTPVDSGNLKANTTHRDTGKLKRRVFNNTEYAADVEFGTPPHTIRPKDKKALAFQAGPVAMEIGTRRKLYRSSKTGGLVKRKSKYTKTVVKSVQHPGTQAQPFMRPGFRAAIPKIKRLLRRAART